MELQAVALSLGLNLNSAKTDVLEGSDVAEQALEVEHSAVDDAIENRKDFKPLEELVDRLLTSPEKSSRTSMKFAAKRMRANGQTYRVQGLVVVAKRMPHAADAWARLFREVFTPVSLQDWYLDYAASDWATHEWSVAQFGRMFPSAGFRPKKALRDFSLMLSATPTPVFLCSPLPAKGSARGILRRPAPRVVRDSGV